MPVTKSILKSHQDKTHQDIQISSLKTVYPWCNWKSAETQLCSVQAVLYSCDLYHGWLSLAILSVRKVS